MRLSIFSAFAAVFLFAAASFAQAPPDARSYVRDTMIMENNRLMHDMMALMRDVVGVMKGMTGVSPEEKSLLDTMSRRLDMMIIQNQNLLMRYQGVPSMPGTP